MPESGCLFWSIRLLLSGGGKDNRTQAWVMPIFQNILCGGLRLSANIQIKEFYMLKLYHTYPE